MPSTHITRTITGVQTYTDGTLTEGATEIRKVHMDEIRDKVVRIVQDIDEHIGNYGDHHKDVDASNSGFMTPDQKHLLEEHTTDHAGPNGLAHGLASTTRHGFESKEDYTDWHNHLGIGGTVNHPAVTNTLDGFMSPAQKLLLEEINNTYVKRDEWLANQFKIYQVTRTSPSMGLGYDGGTGVFGFTVDKGPLEAAAGRELAVNNTVFPMSYTVHSHLYNWGVPFAITEAVCQDDGGNGTLVALRLADAGTYHRSGALQFTANIAFVPANSILSLA